MARWGTWEFDPKLSGKLEELATIPGNCPENSEWYLLFSSAHLFTGSQQEGDQQELCDGDKVRLTQFISHSTQQPLLAEDQADSPTSDLVENVSEMSAEWLGSLTDRQAELTFLRLPDESAECAISAVCETGHAMLATLLCTKFLLPYMQRNPNIDDTIVGDLQRFAASFPSIACANLFVPLMTGPEFDTVSLQAVVKSFSPQMMSTFLSCFLERVARGGSLHEWQLPVLCLASHLFGQPAFARPVVRLLATGRGPLAGSTAYGQLVTKAAGALGADAPPEVVAEMVETVESLETVYRSLAMFALKDTFPLSQE
ncbi:uncharacterized protein LOC134538750 isoform X2 [Bacillus rossius redtenbacheri]